MTTGRSPSPAPARAGGHVLRQYWQPAALSEELTGDRPVVPVTLMNEELVLFVDEQGQLGLLGRQCPHRGVDLSFGRLEDGGLRCPFHGWLLDVDGACLETPAEPETSTFHERIQHRSYPVQERNGIVWAYLGQGAPPPLPEFDCFVAPQTHVFAFKGRWDANWLQSHEVGIDPAHAAFLHRFLEDDSEEYGQQFRDLVADTGVTTAKLMREASPPTIVAEPTPFGFRMRTTRDFPRRVHPRAGLELHLPERDHDRHEPGDEHHPVARPDRRHQQLLVFDVRQLR